MKIKTLLKNRQDCCLFVSLLTALLVVFLVTCSWVGPEKQWDEIVDISELSEGCIPEINSIDYPKVVKTNIETKLAISASCDDADMKYVWSFDSGTTWDTTGKSIMYHTWNVADTGRCEVRMFAINEKGIKSDQQVVIINVSTDYPYIINEMRDTIVSQHDTIFRAFLAGDKDGIIRKYYWGMAEKGWSDSAEVPGEAVVGIFKTDGGPVVVRWGACDNNGLFVLDTFIVIFNRGPDSVALLWPSVDTAVFDSYSLEENCGNITCSLYATDPDSNEQLEYTFIVVDADGDTILSYCGSDTIVKLLHVEASSELSWSLQVKDTFGDSICTEGVVVTPPLYSSIEGMVLIPQEPGEVCNMGQSGFDNSEQPVHPVMFSNGFLMDSTEVTRKAFFQIMEKADTTTDSLLPMSEVTWFDAVMYCNAKSKKYKLDTVYQYDSCNNVSGSVVRLYGLTFNLSSGGFRLPTEAEWEYACRLDELTLYFWGNDAGSATAYCWTSENSGNKSHRIALKKPNRMHLYDMAGNVWEWCNDWFDPEYYSVSPLVDPYGPEEGTERVIRGGSYKHSLYFAQSGTRSRLIPGTGNSTVGFRTVLIVK